MRNINKFHNRAIVTIILALCIAAGITVAMNMVNVKGDNTLFSLASAKNTTNGSSKKMSEGDTQQSEASQAGQIPGDQNTAQTDPGNPSAQTTPAAPGKAEVAAAIKDGAVKLEWKEIKGASGYVILRGSKKGRIAETPYATTDKTHFTDESVKKGNTYFYRVYAYTIARIPADQTDPTQAGVMVPVTLNGEKSDKTAVTVPYDSPVLKSGKVSSSACTLKWKKVKNALYYRIYRKNKDGDFRCIRKKVKTNSYNDKKLEPLSSYGYKICAVGQKSGNRKYTTEMSNEVNITTLKRPKTTAYVGDSIMMALQEYKVMKGRNRKMFCKIGVSPYTFYNNPLMDKLLDYKPDTMFIMLGMNAIEGDVSEGTLNGVIKYYKMIIEECLKENPEMKIVVLPASPVRKGSTARNSVILKYNGMLKTMAEELDVYFYDYTSEMKDSSGQLKKKYAEADKMHWKYDGCVKFRDLMFEYEKTL